jgi:hypothetical protein
MRATRLPKPEPKIVARYKEYAITKGVTNGLFYGFYKDTFLGHSKVMSHVVSLISLREGEGFDINKMEVM